MIISTGKARRVLVELRWVLRDEEGFCIDTGRSVPRAEKAQKQYESGGV